MGKRTLTTKLSMILLTLLAAPQLFAVQSPLSKTQGLLCQGLSPSQPFIEANDPVLIKAKEELRSLTPGSGFENGASPVIAYSRAASRYLAGQVHLTAVQKAALYREFVRRMTHNSEQTWSAQEHIPSPDTFGHRDFVFTGGKGYFLAIRATDGAIFTGMVEQQKELHRFIQGELKEFAIDYVHARQVHDPKELIKKMAGFLSKSNTRKYSNAKISVEILKEIPLEDSDYSLLKDLLEQLHNSKRTQETLLIYQAMAKSKDTKALRLLLDSLNSGIGWQTVVLDLIAEKNLNEHDVATILKFRDQPGLFISSYLEERLTRIVAKSQNWHAVERLRHDSLYHSNEGLRALSLTLVNQIWQPNPTGIQIPQPQNLQLKRP